MARPTLFFSTIKPVQTPKTVIDLGGQGDSLFRAFVAALVDNILHNSLSKSRIAQFELLVRAHNRFFSGEFTLLAQTLLVDNLSQYLKAPGLREKLIGQLAYAVRQLVADYIETNNFSDLGPNEDKKAFIAAMRLVTTKAGKWCSEVLAKIFTCSVHVLSADNEKQLFKRESFGAAQGEAHKLTLCYSMSSDHYYAQVEQPELFKIMRNTALTQGYSLLALKRSRVQDKALAAYKKYVNHLTALFKDHQISKPDLIELYIKVFDLGIKKDPIPAQDVESQNPFEGPLLSFEKSFSLQLIHRIARNLSVTEQRLEPLLPTNSKMEISA